MWRARHDRPRGKEEIFLDKLRLAQEGRSEHIFVLGDWGIGKTSPLRQGRLPYRRRCGRCCGVRVLSFDGRSIRPHVPKS